jgi:hypothetical protein
MLEFSQDSQPYKHISVRKERLSTASSLLWISHAQAWNTDEWGYAVEQSTNVLYNKHIWLVSFSLESRYSDYEVYLLRNHWMYVSFRFWSADKSQVTHHIIDIIINMALSSEADGHPN